jgi:glycosyltransferase involved in cell wall biosynthesis
VLLGIRERARLLEERDRILRGGRDRFAGRRVLVVLPIAAAGGGANIAMFEMRAMRAMGAEIALFNLTAHRQPFEEAFPALDLPVIYGEPQDLVALAAGWDAVVATAYSSVEWLALAARGPHGEGTVFGYFIQDLEAYFYPPGSERFHAALRSYTMMPSLRCFTMTPWNSEELQRLLGVASTPVLPGYDAALFRPRPRLDPPWPARPLRIAAMVRPATPFRSPRLTMQVLGEIARRHGPKVEIQIFGVEPQDAGYADLPRDFPFKLAGRLGPRQMPCLVNAIDIFVDFSTWQAMGMTAMEAMSTGCAVVVTRNGGPGIFARHEENCLLVDPHNGADCLAAVDRLVTDDTLRRRLGEQGIRDICRFYPERAAFNMLNALFGPEIDAAQAEAAVRAAEDA